MARLPMRAKHRRPDGTPVVMCEAATYLSAEQAASALALVYAGKDTILQGVHAVRDGLTRAVEEGVLSGGDPDADRVRAYRQVLERHRSRFLRYVEHESGEMRPAGKLGIDPEAATHARVDTAIYFDEQEAARALALVYEGFPQGVRTGRMTCEHGLHRAARDRVWLRRDAPDEDAVVSFQELLRAHDVF